MQIQELEQKINLYLDGLITSVVIESSVADFIKSNPKINLHFELKDIVEIKSRFETTRAEKEAAVNNKDFELAARLRDVERVFLEEFNLVKVEKSHVKATGEGMITFYNFKENEYALALVSAIQKVA
jgi:hypothetical protein